MAVVDDEIGEVVDPVVNGAVNAVRDPHVDAVVAVRESHHESEADLRPLTGRERPARRAEHAVVGRVHDVATEPENHPEDRLLAVGLHLDHQAQHRAAAGGEPRPGRPVLGLEAALDEADAAVAPA